MEKPDERVYYMPTGERERLAVYVGDPEVGIPLIDIADEDCTSPNCRETVTPATSATRVCMTRESAAWLRDVLLSLDLGPAPQAVVTDIVRDFADPARVSLPATTATAQSLPAPERAAFWRGVEQGRRETAEHPGGLVLVLEDGLAPAERARVAELYRSVRGVVAVLPVADVVRPVAEMATTTGDDMPLI